METLLSGVASFILFHVATRPKGKFNKKLPKAKIHNRIEIFPRFNIEAKNRIFHVHHWMVLGPLFIFTQTIGRGVGFLQSDILNGFMLGGFLQGILYEDSFKFIHHNKDYHEKIKKSSYRPVHKKLRALKKIWN